jgi:ferritin-like metal-binding protein YciE
MEIEMAKSTTATDVYLTGLRNQHAVETQAIGTVKNELGRMEPYPELHARMQHELERSTTQAARLDDLLAKHGTSKSAAKEAVTSTVATVAGFAHAGADDEVLKNVLAAVGFKAYEIGSYKTLLIMAEAAGAADDRAVLEQSMQEEQEMGDWLGSHLPDFVHAYLTQNVA